MFWPQCWTKPVRPQPSPADWQWLWFGAGGDGVWGFRDVVRKAVMTGCHGDGGVHGDGEGWS